MARAIAAAIKPLGFQWVSLDLEGYRTGSLNEVLQIRSAPGR
jgi:PP-loop superfamily ATP-utilizing enzyme